MEKSAGCAFESAKQVAFEPAWVFYTGIHFQGKERTGLTGAVSCIQAYAGFSGEHNPLLR